VTAGDARRAARVVAQAKINLFLRVLAREEVGHHQLETLFQRLELGDEVEVRVGVRGRALDVRGAETGPTDRNLAWRAAEAYAALAGWPDGFAIEIEKRVPVGGGLGGGSADAGAVLRCLERLNPRPIGTGDLLAVAATLGADVPFLSDEHPLALAWGRGERMLALPPLPRRRVHLAMFERGVATADAFRAFAASRAEDDGAAPRPIVWSPERFASWEAVSLVATNDLEPAVFAMRPEVGEMRAFFAQIGAEIELHRRARGAVDDTSTIARMTGSGATVYLLTPPEPAPSEGWQFVVQWAPDGPPPAPGEGLDIVETATATRVAEVELSG
jgi:4-diphosphocytidyl-2-C-methyl-D-erythritol kinase